jgi:hypothetical protein
MRLPSRPPHARRSAPKPPDFQPLESRLLLDALPVLPTLRLTVTNRGRAAETLAPAKSYGHFVFTRTGPTTDPLTVYFDIADTGTATADDYLPLPASITILAKKSSATLDLIPVDDALAEDPETLTLTLRSDAAYTPDPLKSSATVTIADNEPTVKISSSGKPSENNPDTRGKIRITISRSGGNRKLPLDVYLTLSGTATAGVDFTTPPNPITIPAGKSSLTLDLPVLEDSDIEGPETTTFALTDNSAYHRDAKKPATTLTLADNEPYIDLRVTAATLSTKSLNLASRNPKFSLSASVANLGTVAASPLPLHLWLVDTTNASHTVDLGTYNLPKGIAAGKSARISTSIYLGNLAAAPAPGSYFLQVFADNSALAPVELHATDNTFTGTSIMQVYDATVAASTLRFHRVTVNDQSTMIGGPAATYLVPTGWNFTGSVYWRVNPTAPASLDVKVANPNTLDAVQIFPPGQFVNGNGLGPYTAFPNGSLYYGNEVQPTPADVLTMITQVVIPRLRPNLTYSVVSQEETPGYATAVRAEYPANSASTTTTVTAGRVRIEYAVNGQTVEEDFYVALSIMHMNNVGITYWGADRPLALRAAKGQLDSHAALLMAVAQSETIDLHWYNRYLQLLQIMLTVQLQNIQNAGQLSQYISQTSNEILDSSMDAYWARSAAEDQIHESFLQYINDSSAYYDPNSDRNYIFPGYYDNAWVNSLGDYVLSDNPNYNPNASLSGNWTQLTRQ